MNNEYQYYMKRILKKSYIILICILGQSSKALISLMEKKGYFFIGTNSSGINAFFIKEHLSAKFKKK